MKGRLAHINRGMWRKHIVTLLEDQVTGMMKKHKDTLAYLLKYRFDKYVKAKAKKKAATKKGSKTKSGLSIKKGAPSRATIKSPATAAPKAALGSTISPQKMP